MSYEFEPTGAPDLKNGKGTPGIAKLFVDGELVGQADFPVTVPLALGLGSGFAVGRNPGSSVSVMYASPFPFTGTITKVTVDVSGKPDHDEDEVKKSPSASRHGTAINPHRQRTFEENDHGQNIEDRQDHHEGGHEDTPSPQRRPPPRSRPAAKGRGRTWRVSTCPFPTPSTSG